jgi:signal transduction histidine kinase
VGQLLAVERLRSRLASDLHDEIGSGLSQIAILSEVAKKRLPGDRSEAAGPLDRVAEISRELLDSTNDIVWAINRDRVADLTGRMRKYATEMFSAGEIELEFETAVVMEDRKIDFETRRHIYLIFREGIRNVVRHSSCRHVAIYVSCANGLFSMRVSDDGVGFDPARTHIGQGLVSMRERARSLGGQIEWKSDKGTIVTLRMPLPK